MEMTVDARGLACPQPVIMAKKAIEENERITVLVDNAMAVENIRRLAVKLACGFSSREREGEVWELSLVRTGPLAETTDATAAPAASAADDDYLSCRIPPGKDAGPLVVVLSDNHMGRGDDTLGDILIRSFIHTLLQLKPLPATIICYNVGIKLAVKGSAVLDDLRELAAAGVNILVCGTCANYFDLGGEVAVGQISNMYDIAETMAGAGRLVRP